MNNIKYFLLLSSFLILISGCIHRQNTFDSYETQALLNENYTLFLRSGIITPLDTMNQNILYHIHFDKVSGGDTKLFGKWTLSEGDGHNAKRLTIKKDINTIHSLSIDELKNINQSVVNLNKFVPF